MASTFLTSCCLRKREGEINSKGCGRRREEERRGKKRRGEKRKKERKELKGKKEKSGEDKGWK